VNVDCGDKSRQADEQHANSANSAEAGRSLVDAELHANLADAS
jgi:hypothetical protein